MTSRLPITVRPACNELAVSYLTRLAALHNMPFAELREQVSGLRRGYGKGKAVKADLLATVAGQPRERLESSIIELRVPRPDWKALRHEPQRGCWRCNARHPGGPVIQLLPPLRPPLETTRRTPAEVAGDLGGGPGVSGSLPRDHASTRRRCGRFSLSPE